jgi:hypothetical protein
MQHYDLIEEILRADGRRVFSHAYKMLPIKIQGCASAEVAFPVHLNKNIVISWLELHLHCGIMVAIENVVDVLTQLLC